MQSKKLCLIWAGLILLFFQVMGDDPWLVPVDSLIYREIEELFIISGKVTPFKEKPVTAESLIYALNRYLANEKDPVKITKAQKIIEKIKLPLKGFRPILEWGLQGFYNSEKERKVGVVDDSGMMIDFMPMYALNNIPSLLKFGFLTWYDGFSVLFQPELRASLPTLWDENNVSNIPLELPFIEQNFPYRGIFTYYRSPLEVRFGRDKLHLGPSRWSTLTLSQYMPHFDFVKAEYFTDTISVSLYLLQLNANITAAESDYLESIVNANPEGNTEYTGDSYIDRYKHYAIARFSFNPAPWMLVNISQTNLIAGRFPWLSDINPLGVYHNIYAEGVYSVPVSINASLTPLPGMNLYFDYLFYDAVLGDETVNPNNAGAAGYQAGFNLLSTPYFNSGPGRFRLDGEITLTDPWLYGKYYNLRKFTSRFIYVVSGVGRFWVDYPLGFYTGPDSLDTNLALSYGIPGEWEAELLWNRNGMGSIDLYGYGAGNDYSHIGEAGYERDLTAPSGIVQWTDTVTLSWYFCPLTDLKLYTWYTLKAVQNRYHVVGDNQVFHNVGIGGEWKVY